jgi:hypothetical protein
MKSYLILTALFSMALFSFCKGEKTGLHPDWGTKADSSSKEFIRNYWNPAYVPDLPGDTYSRSIFLNTKLFAAMFA